MASAVVVSAAAWPYAGVVEAVRHAAAIATEAHAFAHRTRRVALFVAAVLAPLNLPSDKTNSPDCARCSETMTM
jgi:hypothetical protein